jgi:hypothetical protein
MITPSCSLTATERVLPRLALDFTTATLDPRVTFTRSGNTATVTDSSGVIVAINADFPRFDFNPSTLICKGLLIEESRTNVLLNSLIDGTDLATQSVTVTAAARTLSFYGIGQIVLSGAHSATVTGTGAYPTRTTLTFTPTSGTLTLTVTGTVQFAQLELGTFSTSFIPTTASQVTRTADVATMTGTNFSDWYNATEGAFVSWASGQNGSSNRIFSANDAGATNRIMGFFNGAFFQATITDSSAVQANVAVSVASTLAQVKGALSYKLDNVVNAANGTLGTPDTTCTIPTVNRLNIGSNESLSGNFLNGHLAKLFYYQHRLTNNEVRAFSK